MDSLSKEVVFAFADVNLDGGCLNEPWQVYLRIVGSFSVHVGKQLLYLEESFCVVEFAIKSQLWLARVNETQEDFVYTSQESEERDLFWIRQSGAGWRIGSVYQEYEEPSTFPLDLLAAALRSYFNRLQAFVAEAYGRDIVDVLSWASANQVVVRKNPGSPQY
jgi:hypothetical protein